MNLRGDEVLKSAGGRLRRSTGGQDHVDVGCPNLAVRQKPHKGAGFKLGLDTSLPGGKDSQARASRRGRRFRRVDDKASANANGCRFSVFAE